MWKLQEWWWLGRGDVRALAGCLQGCQALKIQASYTVQHERASLKTPFPLQILLFKKPKKGQFLDLLIISINTTTSRIPVGFWNGIGARGRLPDPIMETSGEFPIQEALPNVAKQMSNTETENLY
jgi:hypothetical protein